MPQTSAMTDSKKVAITWIELVLLVLTVIAGMGIWVVIKQRVELSEKADEPVEVNYQNQAQVLLRQTRYSFIQNELTTAQTKLAQEQIDERRKEYLLETLINAEKNPTSSPTRPATAPTPNTDIEKTKTDLVTTKRLIGYLTSEVKNKEQDSINAYIDLETAKRLASANFAESQFRFQWGKRFDTLYYGSIVIGGLLFLVWLIISIVGRLGRFTASRVSVVGGATTLLAILIGYETFELAGAALVGVLVVIVILILIPTEKNTQET